MSGRHGVRMGNMELITSLALQVSRSCLLFRSPRPSSVTATVKGLLAWLIHRRLIRSPEYKQLKVANDLLPGLNQCSFTPFDIQKIFHTPGESSVPARGFSVTQHLESNRFLFNFPNMKFYIILNLFHELNMLSRPARGSDLTWGWKASSLQVRTAVLC